MINNKQSNLYLACTAEDADFLAREVLSYLENNFTSVGFACFWTERFSPFDVSDLEVAPILRKYKENPLGIIDYLIIINSIISTVCVVKNNLIDLLQNINPHTIFIVTPVMCPPVEEEFKIELEQETYRKCKFIYFDQNETGFVPKRLGSYRQDDKNRCVPKIVESRRSRSVNI